MKTLILTILFTLISMSSYSQNNKNLIRYYSSKPFTQLARKFRLKAKDNGLTTTNKSSDLIIGYPDPNEIVSITGEYYLNGNLTIVNNGTLNIDSANFKIDGDIFITNAGQLNVRDSYFTVIQEFIYEHDAVVAESGILQFCGVQFRSSGQSWSNAFADSASYILKNSDISDGFITTAFLGESKGIINNTQMPGEFLCFGPNNLEITNSDLLLMWLVLPDSSVVDFSLPNDSLVTNWNFSSNEPLVDNIPYSLKIDSCSNVMWGLISISGSQARFSDTEFRTIGLMFQNSDSLIVSNITNESNHSDENINVPDRELHLINSQVHTWSFYASSNSNITIENCVFGELLAQDSSKVLINNSICDGTGGYIGAFHQSFLLITGSFIKSQVISRQNAVLVGAGSTFWGSEIDADESSLMFIANTATAVEPQAHYSAVIFEANCPYAEGIIDEFIPIFGTARIIKGPENPIQFYGYEVAYSPDFENPLWQQIEGFQPDTVLDDTLVLWDTQGLLPGNYALQLSLHHSFGEPIPMVSSARLNVNTDIQENNESTKFNYILSQNFPNPFNTSTTIRFGLPNSSSVILKIFDMKGKEVVTLIDGELPTGIHEINYNANELPSGMYFYSLKTQNLSQMKKFIIIK
jgi:hypothetical protein